MKIELNQKNSYLQNCSCRKTDFSEVLTTVLKTDGKKIHFFHGEVSQEVIEYNSRSQSSPHQLQNVLLLLKVT